MDLFLPYNIFLTQIERIFLLYRGVGPDLHFADCALQSKLDQSGLGFGSDIWMAFLLIHGSVNLMNLHHGGEINNRSLCPVKLLYTV